MIDQTYIDALGALGANSVPHSKRKLLDHLIGTHNLLKSWETPYETCLAGLFHSIYGTVHFMNQTVSITSRKTIQDLIGQEAELLVFLFCVTDRQELFANNGCSTCTLHDIRNQTQWTGSPDILNQLLTIALANWLEMFPYIGQELSAIEVSRNIELFETARASFPARAIDTLMRFKRIQVGQYPDASSQSNYSLW
ncbi:MAG: DUF6817 domain-containing protein [Nitrospirales bacterium]